MARTLCLTVLLCAVHLSLSAAIVALGLHLRLEWTLLSQAETLRQTAVGWFLLLCGALCLAWSCKPVSAHARQSAGGKITFWMVFCALLLGPCEVLLPLVAPAVAAGDTALAWQLVLLFSIATLLSMLVAVGLLSRLRLHTLSGAGWFRHRAAHALSGAVFVLCGGLLLTGVI